MATSEAVLKLQIPPQPHLSRLVRERIVAFAAGHGVDAGDLSDFLTATGEAVANAIEHAGSAEPIRVECRLSSESITAIVEDNGIGFARPPEITADLPEPTAERGRGLPLMRRCSDILVVNSAPGRGTAVKVGRYLRRPLGRTPRAFKHQMSA
jgi:serine/threonine-protein kinase RsbW